MLDTNRVELALMSTMARGKTKIALITDEKVLKSTFQKRKKGLIKKATELTTLCDIVACVIIYSPPFRGRAPEIFTWPEDQDKVQAAIKMYKEKTDRSKRTADLCNYLKDRRRLEAPDHSSGYAVGEFPQTQQGDLNIPAELVVAYLNWVDARIKAVAERIEFVKSSVMSENMMLVPAMPNQDQNFNLVHGFNQEWIYSQNPCEDFPYFDLHVYDQTLSQYNPLYKNLVPPGMVQFQSTIPNQTTYHQQNQTLFENFDHSKNQMQNQMILYDPYLLGVASNNMTASSFNGGQYYQQQRQHGENMHSGQNYQQQQHRENMHGGQYYQQQQRQHGENMHGEQHYQQQQGENMQYLNNAAPGNSIPSNNMDERMQLCPYPEKWSGSDISSSNYSASLSNQLNKAAIDVPSFDDQLEFHLQKQEFAAEFQPSGNRAAGGTHW